MKWVVQSFDITTAFLRGHSDERELAMEVPKKLKEMMGMKDNQVCLLQGNAYGRVDAPLLFYPEFTVCSTGVIPYCLYPKPCTNRDNRVFSSRLALKANRSSGEINPSAAAYSISSSLDKLTWIRTMSGYIKSLDFDGSKPELSLKGELKGLMITDCKSLYDLIAKNAVPNCPECRTAIEIVLLKKQSRDHTACRRVSTAIMIADCFTKPVDSRFMRTILQFDSRWSSMLVWLRGF